MKPRWKGDARGIGVTDGAWIAPSVTELQDALAEPGWIAESPEEHLLAHRQRACAHPDAEWRLGSATTQSQILAVDLTWTQQSASIRELRADVYALIGQVAEGTTFVRQVVAEGGIEFHVTTGLLPGDSRFASHGHLLRWYVAAPRQAEMIAGLRSI
jgi:hypothetical protein